MCDITNLAEHKEEETCKIYQFPDGNKDKEQEEDLLEKECTKMKKDGTPKRTKNNSKRNRDNIQPFKESDVPLMKQYFVDKIASSPNHDDELTNRRDLALFKMGINIGLRASDLVSLRWNDVYDKEWNFLSGKTITPKKTSHTDNPKHVLLKYNDAFKQAITEYKEHYGEIRNMNSYIFKSRQDGQGHMCVERVGQIIKEAAKAVGIKYPVCTHSMRKTFARVRYDHSTQKDKTLVELMYLFNHASTVVTLHYICIGEEELEDLYNDVNL